MSLPPPSEAPTADAGDEVQPRADSATAFWEDPDLDWQPELDSALEAIDSILPVKRRRSTDPPGTPPYPRPELGPLTFTPEILDALASQVAEKLRGVERARPAAVREPPAVKDGKMVSIRFRWPLFSFGFSRRRRRAMARG